MKLFFGKFYCTERILLAWDTCSYLGFNYSHPGGVWFVTSWLGTGKSPTFLTVYFLFQKTKTKNNIIEGSGLIYEKFVLENL
jgi:hypothetical protein